MSREASRGRTWPVCIALASFAAGALLTVGLAQSAPATADNGRIFELRIYHAVPGKLPVMESRFRDVTSKLLSKHNLNVLGYWTGSASDSDVFVFLLAHSSREEATRNWAAMAADPEFQQVKKSEQAEKTLEKADIIFLHPSDFSPMK